MFLVRLPALQGFNMLHEINGLSIELPGLRSRADIKAAPFVPPVLGFCASVSFPKPHFNVVRTEDSSDFLFVLLLQNLLASLEI